jgi:hypothetical protein
MALTEKQGRMTFDQYRVITRSEKKCPLNERANAKLDAARLERRTACK